jgi:glycosyltransferase involved in cell wall biosynthesis
MNIPAMNVMDMSTTISPTTKVLQLRSSAGLFGADRMVLTLNAALPGLGVDSCLLSINNYRMRDQPLHRGACDEGQSAELLPCRGRLDPDTVRRLAARVRGAGAVVLHAHDYKSAFYAWLATRRSRVPLMATLHGQVDSTRSLRLYNRLELALLRRFDALAVVSGPQVNTLMRAGVPSSRIHQIDNGISAPDSPGNDATESRQRLGIADDAFVFAAVARFSAEKNLALLLDAFPAVAHAYPHATLLMIGDGPETDMLRARAATLGLESRVRFTGVLPDMGRVYPHIDCLVLPSLREGMPLVVLEAMSHAIPVVASAVGEVPRLVGHSQHGRLVKPGDPADLAEALQAVASAGRQRDEGARRHVLNHHSPAAMAGRYRDLYLGLMEQAHDHQAA